LGHIEYIQSIKYYPFIENFNNIRFKCFLERAEMYDFYFYFLLCIINFYCYRL